VLLSHKTIDFAASNKTLDTVLLIW